MMTLQNLTKEARSRGWLVERLNREHGNQTRLDPLTKVVILLVDVRQGRILGTVAK
jgi:hypothetical protein